jgi:ATP-binding cassette subfamily C protein
MRRLADLLTRREKWGLLVLAGLLVVEALLEMIGVAVIPLFIGLLSDPEQFQLTGVLGGLWDRFSLADQNRTSVVIWASVILLIFYLAKAAYVTFFSYWKVRYVYNRARKLSTRLFTAYLEAPYLFHLRHATSELFRNVDTECMNLAQKVLLPALQLVSQTVVLVGIVVVLILVVPPIALIWLFGFLVVGVLVASMLQARTKKLGAMAQEQRRASATVIFSGLAGAKEIKLLGRTESFTTRLTRTLDELFRIQRSNEVVRQAIPGTIEAIGIAGLLGVTAVLVARDVPPTELVALLGVFAVGLTRLKGAVRVAMTSLHEFRHNQPSLDAVHDALAELERPAPKLQSTGLFAKGLTDSISLQNVSFSYQEKGEPALKGVSLDIAHGEAIGLVGPSGAGKSTLLDVVMGVLEPASGVVSANGTNILDDLAGWQANLGYVPQHLFLLNGSIRENVALGLSDEETDEEKVYTALAAANLSDLVAKLPEGIETHVGDRGLRLSGGERQRLVIARALYDDPDLLMMDEATASLDNTTEAAVVSAIEELKGDRTIVMIAHRLSTVRNCDRLVFMKEGVIEAVGSYEDLLEGHLEFRKMAMA